MMQFLAPLAQMAAAPILGNSNPLSQLVQNRAETVSNAAQQVLGVLLPQGNAPEGIRY